MKRATHLDSIRRSLNTILLILVLAAGYFARDLLLPILLGFLIALTLSPVSRGLARVGIPHWISALGLISITAAGIVVAVYFSAATVVGWVDDARAMGVELQAKLGGIVRQLENVREASEEVADLTSSDPAVMEVTLKQPGLMDSAVSAAGSIGTTLIVSLALASFLLASGNMFYIKLVQSYQTLSGRKRALTMVYDIERRVSRYLLTIALINGGLGVCVGLVLTLIGMPYPYIWGIAAFLLNFLPYLGALIGVAMVAGISIVTFDSFSYATLAPMAYLALTAVEGNLATPMLLGRRLELNTVAVFLTVVVWGWLWGIPGALVAVPFLVIFKVIADNVEGMEIVSNFLGAADTPVQNDDAVVETTASEEGNVPASTTSAPSLP